MNKPKYAAIVRKDRAKPVIGVYYHDGSCKTKTLRVTLETAEAIVERLNRDINLDIYKDSELFPTVIKTTLGEFFEKYLKHRNREAEIGRLSKRTPQIDRNAAVKVTDKDFKLRNVTPEKIEEFIDFMRSQNLSNPTINTYLRTLKTALNWSPDVQDNPFTKVKQLPEDKPDQLPPA